MPKEAGEVSCSLGLPGVPAISDEICINRDMRLTQFTGVHLNIQHATTADGMNTKIAPKV